MSKRRPPKVRIAKPSGRPYQLRYTDRSTGKEIRLSVGSDKLDDAEAEKAKLEARLLLGTDIPRRGKTAVVCGPEMSWDSFMDVYRARHLKGLRKRTRKTCESRLDIAARHLGVRTLAEMAKRESLVSLRDWRLSKGSPHYAKSFIVTVRSALHWADAEGFLPDGVPRVPRIKVAKLKVMRGRPLAGEEFERMLSESETVVGEDAAESYRHTLRGLWTSALRIGELMMVSWDIPETIQPTWRKRQEPVLRIPAALQKNATEEDIPLLPWFDALLQETPARLQTGWVFNPASMNSKFGRKARVERPSEEWVSKVISRIGEKANVVVDVRGKVKKYASAHDLRRSCGERMLNAGVPEKIIQRVMRHESWETTRKHYAPGSVQSDAKLLREILATAER